MTPYRRAAALHMTAVTALAAAFAWLVYQLTDNYRLVGIIALLVLLAWASLGLAALTWTFANPKQLRELMQLAHTFPSGTTLVTEHGTRLRVTAPSRLHVTIARFQTNDIEEAAAELREGASVTTIPYEVVIVAVGRLVYCYRGAYPVRPGPERTMEVDDTATQDTLARMTFRTMLQASRSGMLAVSEADLDKVIHQLRHARAQ
ncbi:hypothetical protein ACQEVF_57425 [Nonomuraea polychroma]|uniref:hypothetical protein n=1 Tax=Nonomuraea polychroma TaxID=46176 RepID=UPI003D8D7AFC